MMAVQVTQVLNSTSLLSIWSFLSSTQLQEVMLVRFVLATLFVIVQYPLLTSTGPFVTELDFDTDVRKF